ncbi:MAG TPA: porin [Azospirillaceae bacterium]|nr:porin [Azospirillaceae bacterium]
MNRYLLAGASALALLGAASAANAQFTVTFTGDSWVEAGYTSIDGNPAGEDRHFDFTQRGRFNLIATQKSDNGLEYGVRFRVRLGPAGGNGLDHDKNFIFLRGAFGEVNFGTQSGVFEQWWPSFNSGTGLADGNYFDYVPGAALPGSARTVFQGVYAGEHEANRTRLSYFSPRIAGFQAGVSYVPTTNGTTGRGRSFEFNGNSAGFQDVFQLGGSYDGTFGAVRARAAVTYAFGSAQDGFEDLSVWQGFARADVGGFGVLGMVNYVGESGLANGVEGDAYTWVVGGEYTFGAFTAGASFTRLEDEAAAVEHTNIWSVGLTYTVAPGLTLRPEYHYIQAEDDFAGNDDTANVFIVRTQVNF